jgi:hypothetical protein
MSVTTPIFGPVAAGVPVELPPQADMTMESAIDNAATPNKRTGGFLIRHPLR